MRNYKDRQVTPPKQVTPPTCGPPPPCKQALNSIFRVNCTKNVVRKYVNIQLKTKEHFKILFLSVPKWNKLDRHVRSYHKSILSQEVS